MTSEQISRKAIDDYANSMFRFENLHRRWIRMCVSYLKDVFGDRIRDATVLDYAFGRGNWSIAFLKAGARRVYAVDAAPSNVSRLRTYCTHNRIRNLEVLEANILDRSLNIKVDIVWTYGILQHLAQADLFVSRLVELSRDTATAFLFYAYEADSLREFVVSAAREVLFCHSERAFRRLSTCFSTGARLRARDDLTAPYIHWYQFDELVSLLERHGVYPRSEVRSFAEFTARQPRHLEFAPFHLLCSLKQSAIVPRKRHVLPLDIEILRTMADAVLLRSNLTPPTRKHIALGLWNTHFAAVEGHGDARRVAGEDFRFLLYALLNEQLDPGSVPAPARDMVRYALHSLSNPDERKSHRPKYRSAIADFLTNQPIRL